MSALRDQLEALKHKQLFDYVSSWGGKYNSGGFAMSKRCIEDGVVNIDLNAMGDMTLNEVCEVGFRQALAEKSSTPLLDMLEKAFEKRIEGESGTAT